jgi:hypothetical protein
MLCRYAECRILFTIMLNVSMLSVVILNVVMLNVVMPSIVMLSVVAPWKGLARTNTIECYEIYHYSYKSLIALGPGANVIKLFCP